MNSLRSPFVIDWRGVLNGVNDLGLQHFKMLAMEPKGLSKLQKVRRTEALIRIEAEIRKRETLWGY